MEALGTQLLLDLGECNRDLLDDLPYIKQTMLDTASVAGATVLDERFQKFDPVGVTGIVAIAESHIFIHTWPEYGYAAADIFSCGRGFDPREAADVIIQRLQCGKHEVMEVPRGLMSELAASSA